MLLTASNYQNNHQTIRKDNTQKNQTEVHFSSRTVVTNSLALAPMEPSKVPVRRNTAHSSCVGEIDAASQ
jgi:hypothetical protein